MYETTHKKEISFLQKGQWWWIITPAALPWHVREIHNKRALYIVENIQPW